MSAEEVPAEEVEEEVEEEEEEVSMSVMDALKEVRAPIERVLETFFGLPGSNSTPFFTRLF